MYGLLADLGGMTDAAKDLLNPNGRSDGSWIAALIIVGVFVLAGMLIHFVAIPWINRRIESDKLKEQAETKRSENEEKSREELVKAVTTLCDITGKTHVLSVSSEGELRSIRSSLDRIIIWKQAATDVLALLVDTCPISDPHSKGKLIASIGSMRGAIQDLEERG